MSRGSGRLAAAGLVGFGLFWLGPTVADPDLWGHVRFGLDVLRDGGVAQVDPYSYRTAGRRWINHEWLAEALFAGAYRIAGPGGLVGVKLAAAGAILGLAYRHLRRSGMGAGGAAGLLAASCVPFRLGLNSVRPQMFTYLLFLGVLLVLDGARAGRGRRLGLLPPLFALWANLHGGVLAGLGIVGVWVAGRVVGAGWGRDEGPGGRAAALARGLVLLAACVAATGLNPYGFGLLGFLLRTATVPRPEITEWAPLEPGSVPGAVGLGLVLLGIAGLIGGRRPVRAEEVAVFAAACVLPMAASRHYPLFAAALWVVAGPHLAEAAGRRGRAGGPAGRAALGVLAAGMLVAGVASLPRLGCIRIEPGYFAFPARAVALLRNGGVSGNLALPYNWGEYAIWHLGPRVKVSVDGRRETVYSEGAYARSWDFQRGTGRWDRLLAEGPTDLVLTANGSPTMNLMAREPGWRALYQDSSCAVFVRGGYPGLGKLLAAPLPGLPEDGRGLCFPAGPPAGGRGVSSP